MDVTIVRTVVRMVGRMHSCHENIEIVTVITLYMYNIIYRNQNNYLLLLKSYVFTLKNIIQKRIDHGLTNK